MPTSVRSRVKQITFLRVGLALISVGLACFPGVARASANCHLSGQGNSFQAYRIDAQFGALINSVQITVPLSAIGVVGDNSNYYKSYGFVIFNSSGNLEDYYLVSGGGLRPRVVVSNGSQTLLDAEGATIQDLGTASKHYYLFGIGKGTHYLVGFSFGNGAYDATFSIGANCVPVSPASTLVQKDHTDFSATSGSLPSSGQIYAMGVGIGNNLKLSVPNPRRFFVGYLAKYTPSDNQQLTFSTPAPGPQKSMGTLQQSQTGALGQSDDRLAVWGTGTANFTLNYKFLPNVHIDGWLLDL